MNRIRSSFLTKDDRPTGDSVFQTGLERIYFPADMVALISENLGYGAPKANPRKLLLAAEEP
jgi:hypothetical protein